MVGMLWRLIGGLSAWSDITVGCGGAEQLAFGVYVVLAAEQYADAISLAPKALAQQATDDKNPLVLAELEFDVGLALLKLHELIQPGPFNKTPQQLLQSAARRGYNSASLFLNSSSRSTLHNARNSRKPAAMPGWVTQLAARGARVSGGSRRVPSS